MKEISLYIHIPFCRCKCNYCDFFSVTHEPDPAGRYVEALSKKLRIYSGSYDFSTVYCGGGTPSVLSVDQLYLLLSEIALKAGAEFTVEVNPESVSEEKLSVMRAAGVNRLSIGIQSLYDSVLDFLGRPHTVQQAYDAVYTAFKSGFDNLSVDLIYAVPGKTLAMWKEELKTACSLPVKHISLYSLTYERGTPLFKDLQQSRFVPVPDTEDAAMYQYAQEFLADNGFIQYEISNFAREGFYSRHNDNYWKNGEYAGIGAGAVEYLDRERRRNIEDVEAYITAVNKGGDTFVEKERLAPEAFALETAVLNLRSKSGIVCDSFISFTGYDIRELRGREIDKLIKEGLVEHTGNNRFCLTCNGFRFYDYIARELI